MAEDDFIPRTENLSYADGGLCATIGEIKN